MCTNCRTLDWRDWTQRDLELEGNPAVPTWQVASPAHNGSISTVQNQAAIENDALEGSEDHSVSQESRGMEDFLGVFVTPPRAGTLPNPIPVDNYAPLDGHDGWTSDSQDGSWMAAYADFTGNSSAEDNSDWAVSLEGESTIDRFSLNNFDFSDYEEYTFRDNNHRVELGDIRHRYSDSSWGHNSHELLVDRTFRGPHPGWTERGLRQVRREQYFFGLWWDDRTVATLVEQTNLYASQQCTNVTDPRRRGRPAGLNGRPNWRDTDAKEFRAFLGVVILMGLKTTPTIRDYWSQDIFWRCNLIPKVLTRDRFESILRCLHCVNNEGLCRDKAAPQYDKIGKVRWLLEHFVRRSKELYNPDKMLTADEVMIAYRGHFSPIRQYMKSKPTRYGFKFWALVCNPTRYIYNLIPYVGKSDEPDEGQGSRIVHQLTTGLQQKGHVVCCDNFFTSPHIFDGLLKRGIYATGTVVGKRIGFPTCLARFKRGEHPRETIFWQMHESRQMAASTWFDSKPVSFLSTHQNPLGPAQAHRWLNGVRQAINTTLQQVEYEKNMRGVDLVDQMRRYYTTQFHSRKWWHKIVNLVLD
jgi:hypothetical protein